MHDAHCHLDLYSDPYQVAEVTERARIMTIVVTNLPSAFFAANSRLYRFRYLKPAIGLHPLLAQEHTQRERQLFAKGFSETRFVGEVGLDFSRHGIHTKEVQVESFRFVLELMQQQRRFVSVHSRRAEAAVLELLDEYRVSPAVFHWYSGSLGTLDQIVAGGHYFSVNPAMIASKNGRKIIERIPRDRVLTESDGPFVKLKEIPVVPEDVQAIHGYLSAHWNVGRANVEMMLERNLIQCIRLST